MSYQVPKFRHPDLPLNDLGYTKAAPVTTDGIRP